MSFTSIIGNVKRWMLIQINGSSSDVHMIKI